MSERMMMPPPERPPDFVAAIKEAVEIAEDYAYYLRNYPSGDRELYRNGLINKMIDLFDRLDKHRTAQINHMTQIVVESALTRITAFIHKSTEEGIPDVKKTSST